MKAEAFDPRTEKRRPPGPAASSSFLALSESRISRLLPHGLGLVGGTPVPRVEVHLAVKSSEPRGKPRGNPGETMGKTG